jgi:hypothetical protein
MGKVLLESVAGIFGPYAIIEMKLRRKTVPVQKLPQEAGGSFGIRRVGSHNLNA